MTTSSKVDPALLEAITRVDNETLQAIFKRMCESSEEFAKAASLQLLTTTDKAHISEETENDEPDAEHKTKRQKRDGSESRPILRYQKCSRCEKQFDVTQNGKTACQTHSGELEVDDAFFEDDDEDPPGTHGLIEDDWRFKDFPEAFRWACCDGDGDAIPCSAQPHIV